MMLPAKWPDTIRGINDLSEEQKHAIYRSLLPDWALPEYGLDFYNPEDNPSVITLRCPSKSRAVEITVKRHIKDHDCLFYLNMADTFNHQLIVLLVVVNDLDSPRYDTDVDPHGNPTQLGTASRNLVAEQAAMQAGLSPGQVRRGLRAFKLLVPVFEEFVSQMGHKMFFIEPLSYANAIMFERYGFNYQRGLKDMMRIHEDFQPGGVLHTKLAPDNPFRMPDAWQTVRGRAWAIHDGILGHPFTGFQMYRRVGKHAGISTFPDARW